MSLHLLSAFLRTDLYLFVWKVFNTLLPGTTYLENWHIDAICHELMRIRFWREPTALDQSAAAFAEINLRLDCLRSLAIGQGSNQAHYCRELLQ